MWIYSRGKYVGVYMLGGGEVITGWVGGGEIEGVCWMAEMKRRRRRIERYIRVSRGKRSIGNSFITIFD